MSTIYILAGNELDLLFLRREFSLGCLCHEQSTRSLHATENISKYPLTFRAILIDSEHKDALDTAKKIREDNPNILIIFWGIDEIFNVPNSIQIPKQRGNYGTLYAIVDSLLREREERESSHSIFEDSQSGIPGAGRKRRVISRLMR